MECDLGNGGMKMPAEWFNEQGWESINFPPLLGRQNGVFHMCPHMEQFWMCNKQYREQLRLLNNTIAIEMAEHQQISEKTIQLWSYLHNVAHMYVTMS